MYNMVIPFKNMVKWLIWLIWLNELFIREWLVDSLYNGRFEEET